MSEKPPTAYETGITFIHHNEHGGPLPNLVVSSPEQFDIVLHIEALPSGRRMELSVWSRPGESPLGKSAADLNLTAEDRALLMKYLDAISERATPRPPDQSA